MRKYRYCRKICLLGSHEISNEILQSEVTNEYPLGHSEEEELVLVVLGPDLFDGGDNDNKLNFYLELRDGGEDQHTDGGQQEQRGDDHEDLRRS